MNIITWSLVVLQRNHIFGPFLQTLQEVDNKVSNIFSVGRLECEFLITNCHQREGLRECFAASKNRNHST